MSWKDIIDAITGKARQLDGDDPERIKVLDRCAAAWVAKPKHRMRHVKKARKEAMRLAYPDNGQ